MRPQLEKRKYRHQLSLDCWENRGFDFMAHLHPEVEWCLILEGEQMVSINGETRMLTAGWLSVCGSHDVHHYRKSALPSRHILLIFRPEMVGYPGLWPAGNVRLSHFLSPGQAAPFVPLLLSLVREFQTEDDFQPRIMRGLLEQLCGLMDRHLALNAGASRTPRQAPASYPMGRAIEYIRLNSHRDLRLADVAASIPLSPWYFSRSFYKASGQTFTAYLNAVRLERAEELLLESKLNVVDIALECGFGSVRSFNRAWKELRGGSPRHKVSTNQRVEL